MRNTVTLQASFPPRMDGRRQQGMVLVFALIALLILGIGAVSLIRSFDTSTVTAVNLGFKRDLTGEAGLALAQVDEWLSNAAELGSPATQQNDNTNYNYFAETQPTNQFGIPTALMDSTPAANLQLDPASTYGKGLQPGVTVYFMVERLCDAAGAASTTTCMTSMSAGSWAACTAGSGGQTGQTSTGAKVCDSEPVYRITVRVQGPHNTYTFIQQTATT